MPLTSSMTRKYVAVGLAEVVDSHHVLVQQPGGDLGLEPEPLADLLAALFLEDLDGDAALEDLVGGRIDRPHAAAAQLLFQEEPWLSVVPMSITVRLPPL